MVNRPWDWKQKTWALCYSIIFKRKKLQLSRCCSVAKSYPTLCDPMDGSMPASLSFTVSRVCSNSCPLSQGRHPPSHPLLPPSPPALNLSQHQGLFQWVGRSHQVVKVLELQLQHQSFQWIIRVDFLQDWLAESPCSPRDFQESSPAPQFESISSSAPNLPYGPTLTAKHDYWKSRSFDCMDLCWQSDV